MKTYVSITPARDEEKLLPGMIASITAQTVKPARWIVIDDGSRDATGKLLDAAAARHPWIEPHHLPRDRPRELGGESVIMRFLPESVWSAHDYILRLDADLTFPENMVELLMNEFARNDKLGIAGAMLSEPSKDGWRQVRLPVYHTRGAVKMYSTACFAAIGGLESGQGWDAIDEASAMMRGFKTRSFPHIDAFHHRPQGSAGGLYVGRFNTGRAAYRVGYSPIFLLARAVRRAWARPALIGSLLMLAGYCDSYLRRLPRGASPELVRFIRQQQLRRLFLRESVWD
ncbi:MAG: glycosyltransferase family 2 protein [Candidatus Binataceae bacterium]